MQDDFVQKSVGHSCPWQVVNTENWWWVPACFFRISTAHNRLSPHVAKPNPNPQKTAAEKKLASVRKIAISKQRYTHKLGWSSSSRSRKNSCNLWQHCVVSLIKWYSGLCYNSPGWWPTHFHRRWYMGKSDTSLKEMVCVWTRKSSCFLSKQPDFTGQGQDILYFQIAQNITNTRWNESFLNDKGDSGDESSAKVLFKQPPTIHV